MDDLVIVDCQYDFIDGTLACENAHEAVAKIVSLINKGTLRPLYTSDWHSPSNHSFKVNGGIWPVHCVAGTHGAELDEAFTKDVTDAALRPSGKNRFLKGQNDEVEEYSAFNGKNEEGKTLGEEAIRHVVVTGIASEYCVRETVLALLSSGRTVSLYVPGLAWVKEEDHKKNLKDLSDRGVVLLQK